MKDFAHKIPDGINRVNSEGVYLGTWQGPEIANVIEKYLVEYEIEDHGSLFKRLDKDSTEKDRFIDDIIRAKLLQKTRSLGYLNSQDVLIEKDKAFVMFTRRIVHYKQLKVFALMLQNYAKDFSDLGITVLIGGRKFDRNQLDYASSWLGSIDHTLSIHPELKKNVFILPEDEERAGYNIADAPILFQGLDATIMLSTEKKEAGPTSPSKGLVNGAAMIASKSGVIREILKVFKDSSGGNGFEVPYSDNSYGIGEKEPTPDGLFEAFREFSEVYRDNANYRTLVYESIKTGMLKCDISTRQAPGLIHLWEEALKDKKSREEDMQSIKESVERFSSNLDAETIDEILRKGKDVIKPFMFYTSQGERSPPTSGLLAFRDILRDLHTNGIKIQNGSAFESYYNYIKALTKGISARQGILKLLQNLQKSPSTDYEKYTRLIEFLDILIDVLNKRLDGGAVNPPNLSSINAYDFKSHQDLRKYLREARQIQIYGERIKDIEFSEENSEILKNLVEGLPEDIKIILVEHNRGSPESAERRLLFYDESTQRWIFSHAGTRKQTGKFIYLPKLAFKELSEHQSGRKFLEKLIFDEIDHANKKLSGDWSEDYHEDKDTELRRFIVDYLGDKLYPKAIRQIIHKIDSIAEHIEEQSLLIADMDKVSEKIRALGPKQMEIFETQDDAVIEIIELLGNLENRLTKSRRPEKRKALKRYLL